MGLDTVELVMAIEREFDIRIHDAAARGMYTVGDMQRYILAATAARPQAPTADYVWERICAIIEHEVGVKPSKITPTTRFVADLHMD